MWLVETLKRKRDKTEVQLKQSKYTKVKVEKGELKQKFDSLSEFSSTNDGGIGHFSEEQMDLFKKLKTTIVLPSQLEQILQTIG